MVEEAEAVGPALRYDYDAARRLTAVRNDAGERIAYALDAQGNRTGEVIRAAGGARASIMPMM